MGSSCSLSLCKDQNPSCVNLNVDPSNCGECGVVCAPGQSCQNGFCAPNCMLGLTACDAACVNTYTDVHNCGQCSFECQPLQVCTRGTCVRELFASGGSEQDTACNPACEAWQTCTNGMCLENTCSTGFKMCPVVV